MIVVADPDEKPLAGTGGRATTTSETAVPCAISVAAWTYGRAVAKDRGSWQLCRYVQEPEAASVRGHFRRVRKMDDSEAAKTLERLALMANVSAHVLTEPLYRVVGNLYDFVNDTLSKSQSLDVTDLGVDLTLALDQFLNQLPLARSRMLRTVCSFVGDEVAGELKTRFDAEYAKPSAWRTLWEVRNSTQHAILPILLIELGVQMTETGATERSWLLRVDHWRRLHTGFPGVLDPLSDALAFPELVSELIAFIDSQMGHCFLAAGDRLDHAAMSVLQLVTEVEATAVDGKPWTPMMVRYNLDLPGQNFDQRVLRPDRCAEVIMNTDLARERAGKVRRWPQPPEASKPESGS